MPGISCDSEELVAPPSHKYRSLSTDRLDRSHPSGKAPGLALADPALEERHQHIHRRPKQTTAAQNIGHSNQLKRPGSGCPTMAGEHRCPDGRMAGEHALAVRREPIVYPANSPTMDRFQRSSGGAELAREGHGADSNSWEQRGVGSGDCEEVTTEFDDKRRRERERYALAPAFGGAVADPREQRPLEKVR